MSDDPAAGGWRPSGRGVPTSVRPAALTAFREIADTAVSRRHAADLAWLVVGQAGALVLGIVSIRLLTSMGTDAYGLYALVLTVAALMSALAFGPAEQGFLRFYYPAAERGWARAYLALVCRGLLLGGTVLGAATCAAAFWAWRRLGADLAVFVMAGGAFAVASAGTGPASGLLNLLGRRRLNATLQLLERVIVVAALWMLGRSGRLTVTSALLAGLAGVAVAAVVRVATLRAVVPEDRPADDGPRAAARRDAVQSVASFSAPFAIWGLAGWLQSNSERWIIGTVLSTADVGVFAVMLTIANVLIAYPYGVLTQMFTPGVYRRFQDHRDGFRTAEGLRLIRVFGLGMAALTVVSAGAALLFGRLVVSWLSGPAFAAFWYLLPVVCAGTGLFYVGQALGLVGTALNRPGIYLAPKLVAGVLAVVLNGAAAWWFGLTGVALAGCAVGGVYTLSVVRANRRALASLAAGGPLAGEPGGAR